MSKKTRSKRLQDLFSPSPTSIVQNSLAIEEVLERLGLPQEEQIYIHEAHTPQGLTERVQTLTMCSKYTQFDIDRLLKTLKETNITINQYIDTYGPLQKN